MVYLSNIPQLCSVILDEIISWIHLDNQHKANCRVVPVGAENTELCSGGLNPAVSWSMVRSWRIRSFWVEMELKPDDKGMLFRK